MILSEIVTLNMPIIAHIRGASLAQEERWSALGVEVSRAPLPFAEAVSRASCVIHHGGAGAIAVAAATGRPQLLVPRHLEHWLNARSLVRLGVGLIAHEGGWKDAVLQLEQASRKAMRWAEMISANFDGNALRKWGGPWMAATG
jgi:UDP-N-acetylglucosamine:LPS N-acetylglucosamine transferase